MPRLRRRYGRWWKLGADGQVSSCRHAPSNTVDEVRVLVVTSKVGKKGAPRAGSTLRYPRMVISMAEGSTPKVWASATFASAMVTPFVVVAESGPALGSGIGFQLSAPKSM